MKEERKVQQSDIDEAKVILKPVAGIRPELYMPAIYAIGLILILFLVLVYPGIKSNGSYLVLEGAPFVAEVRIDGAYAGSTDQKVFVQTGKRHLEIRKAGYKSHTASIEVGGRLVGSLFFPRIMKLSYSLSPVDRRASLQRSFEEYAAWSLTGKPSALYQIPLVLSEGAWDYSKSGSATVTAGEARPIGGSETKDSDPGANPDRILPLRSFASDALAAAQSAESARDGLRAVFVLGSGGSLSAPGLLEAVRISLSALGSDAGGAVWLRDIAPKLGSAWSDRLKKIAGSDGPAGSPPRPFSSVRVAGQEYILYSAGTIRMEGQAPSGSSAAYTLALGGFGIGSTEVTNAQWAEFLSARPFWKRENANALIEAGLVGPDYLATWPGSPQSPVTGVSWNAAQAFCAWKSEASGDYEVILPSESMWEAAASASLRSDPRIIQDKARWSDPGASGPASVGSSGFSSGLADIFGNVWEWTSSPYIPYPVFAAGSFSGREKAVRGGSWGNHAGSVGLGTRGGMEPEGSSPFLGFRTAIRKR
ncbi:MAG TPA: formylglycine-generating enzyme family protein [Rectinemataceae bacterium]